MKYEQEYREMNEDEKKFFSKKYVEEKDCGDDNYEN